MDDNRIIELYFARSESAISETAVKYGGYCFSIAHNILENRQDAEESVNDTYLAAWNAMPPHRPSLLGAFLGKITRHLSIDRWRTYRAAKRGGGEVVLALEELEEFASDNLSAEDQAVRKELCRGLNRALAALSETERSVFVCRYWYLDAPQTIADNFGFTKSKVVNLLYRTRIKLRTQLEQEGLL